MKFSRQLRMLCWKNFTTRKRKKVRFLVELLWPLFLASMICLLRLFSHRNFKSECHFANNALPSAGMLPFLQTMVCNTLNNCYDHTLSSEQSGQISDFDSAGISRLFADIEELLGDESFAEDWTAVVNDLSELQKTIPQLDQSPGEQPLSSLLNEPEIFRDYLTSEKRVISSVSDAVLAIPISSNFARSLISGEKAAIEQCFPDVDKAVKEPVSLVKSTQTEFCESLTAGDYEDIGRALRSNINTTTLFQSLTPDVPTGGELQPLSSILVNSSDVRDYMINDLSLTPEAVDVLMEQPASPKELHLLLQGSDMRPTVCNETSLQTCLPTASPEEVHEVSASLCNATDEQLDLLSAQIAKSLSANSTSYLQQLYDEQLAQLQKDLMNLESFQGLMAEITSLSNVDDTQEFICGNLTGTVFDALKAQGNGSSGSGQQFGSGGIKSFAGNPAGGDGEDTPEYMCDWVNMLRNTTSGRVLWEQLQPIVQGYILYSPDTSATRRVIEKAKQPLDTMKMLVDIAYKWQEYSPTIHRALNQSLNAGECEDELQSGLDILNEQLKKDATLPSSDFGTEDYLDFVDAMDKYSALIIDAMRCVELDKFIGFDTEQEMLDAAQEFHDNNTFWAGVGFTGFHHEEEVPSYVNYSIRMISSMVESTHKLSDRFWQPKPRDRSKYIDSGFIFIQDMVESALVQVLTNKNRTEIGVWYHQFPYPCYIEDNFLLILDGMLPLLMTLAWVFSVAMIIKSIVFEKERRLKEVMKVMGLENGVHWMAWFIDSFIMMALSSALLVLVFKVGSITVYSDPSVLFFFLISFSVSTIMLCFLISVLFSKANLAAACGAVFYFLTYIPYVMVYVRDDQISLIVKVSVSLLNTIAFGYGSRYLAVFEIQGVGAQWSNINTSPLNGDTNMTFLQVIGMMWFDALIYWILTWYIEAVHPGHFGIPRPFYFPFTRSYWCGSRPPKNDNMELNQCGFDPHDALNANFEEDPAQLKCGVTVNGLVKVYKTGRKVAVDNLNMKFYENQITSFLGHNGAGKTTTMSILTGLFPPTAGNAFIYGKSILTDIDEIRKSLGMCPQHNVLFDNMTVAEHLWFFARLKGIPPKQVKAEIEKMLKDLQIPQKRDELPSALSGGMKRKLSIAIAFLGGAKCVILDEPTAGVDPYSRREIWDLLNRYRRGRTVIMSTHHMDEADVLGDRIAIIANGKLKCCGSSLFLKGRYGSGYYLVLTKATTSMALRREYATGYEGKPVSADGMEIEDMGYCSEAVVTSFIQRFVPGVELCENIGQELSYLLPFGAIKAGGFQNMFAQLEKNAERLHIKSFGISDTSLEEVFLTVAEESAEFRQGDIDLATDSGLLPRPFMGRGSLRRRSYQLPNVNPTIDRDDVGLLQSDYSERGHHQHATPSRPQEDDKDSALGEEAPEEEKNAPELGPEAGPGEAEKLMQEVDGTPPPVQRHHFGHRRQVSFGNSPTDQPTVVSDMPEDLLELRHLKVKDPWLSGQQYLHLFYKRFTHARRSIKGFLAQVVLPAVFILFAMIFSTLRKPILQPQPLLLAPWIYKDAPNQIIYSKESQGFMSETMEEELNLARGIGTRCLSNDPVAAENFPCDPLAETPYVYEYYREELLELYLNQNLSCSCDSGFMECPDGAEGPRPPHKRTATTDVLHNMTDTDLSDYIIKTTEEYVLQRFGGLSFLQDNELAMIQANETDELVAAWVELNDSLSQLARCDNATEGEIPFGGSIHDLQKRSAGVKNALYSQVYLPEEEFFNELYEVLLSMVRMRNSKVWYDNNGYHALPTYINVMNNLLLRSSLNSEQNPEDYGITAYNYPTNLTAEQINEEILTQIFINQFIAQFVMFGFAFIPAGFVVYVITERVNNAKHLQIVSGVNRLVYWLSTFSWDLINFMIPMLLTIGIFFVCRLEAFVGPDVFPSLLILFVLYGWASVPMAYPISMLFQVPSTGYLSVGCLNILLGMVTVMTSFIINYQAQEDEDLKLLSEALNRVFLIFPPYCLGEGLVNLANNHFKLETYEKFGIEDKQIPSPLEWEQLGRNLVALAIEGFAFFLLTLLLEYKVFEVCFRSNSVPSLQSYEPDVDEDVETEKQRVLSGGAERDIIKIENLTKVYKTGKKNLVAVNRLCVGIPRGECFGFLGVNGAGKTTTFKMLTGDIHVTSGDASVNTYSIVNQIRKVNQSIGYCPQFDALDDLLTGREHLKFYAALRGIPSEYLDRVADWGIQKLGLSKYADKLAGTYSGGNKRKLSTAIALVGNPPVVFLDEPTTGMDPKSRRFLWNCITSIVKEGRSVVLTTHSMEECEALCTRLAIMVNGQFKCLGNIQHLKSKFGDGYTLTIRAASSLPTLEPIQDFMRANFPLSYLREIHLNMLEYQLPTEGTALSRLFGIMEANRRQLNIEDYSISQTTLDQVFIGFAKQQKTGEEDSVSRAEPNVHFNSPTALTPGVGIPSASVHIPDFGNVSTVPSEALPNRNYYSHTPGYSNPLYTIPASPPEDEEEDKEDGDGDDVSSMNLQEFGQSDA